MSNLSIQTVFSAPGVDAANPTQRAFEQSAQQRHYAQAFDEAMQRQSQQQRTQSSPQPQRAKDTTAQPTRNAEAHSKRAQDTQGSAQPRQTAAPTARDSDGAGEQATQVQTAEVSADAPGLDDTQETSDNGTTLTGDLFASLDLSLATQADSPSTPSDTGATALQEAAKPTDGNTISIALTANASTDTHVQPEASAVAESNPSATAAAQATKAKATVLPTAAAAPEAPPAKDGATAQAMQTLPLAATVANDTRESPGHSAARSEHTVLSLSAALSASAAPTAGLSPGASTYTLGHAQVQAPVGSAGFAADFSQRVFMLAGQRVQSAQIALTPADLGPIHISMELKGQEASVLINATHAATRAAIEDALPKLREMFQSQGLDLVNTQVGSQSGQWSGQGNQPGHSAWRHHSQGLGASHPGQTPAGAQTATDTPVSATQTGQMRLVDVRV
ncbi:MAG TPA: flagellar hook-length control protein FliK [Burkholderiaceae bacterium]|nr:flagellar hook-length control protein FliK [Burkholderiaceae bacterium]